MVQQSKWRNEIYREAMENYLNINCPMGMTWNVSDPSPSGRGLVSGFRIRGSKWIDTSSKDGEYADAGYDQVLSACYQQYEACCAFEQMNYFFYSNIETKEEVASLCNHVLTMFSKLYKRSFGKKLVLNTVNTDRQNGGVGSERFYYPFIHDWATSQKIKTLDTSIQNHNTGNWIHHLIVQPDVINP